MTDPGCESISAEVEVIPMRPADGSRDNLHGFRRDVQDQAASRSMLTILPSGDVANVAQDRLDHFGVHEEFADIGCDEGRRKMSDEITFMSFVSHIKANITSKVQAGLIGMHIGVRRGSRTLKDVKKKEEARYAAALLIRLMFIAGLFITSKLPFILIFPWQREEDSITSTGLYESVRGGVYCSRFIVSEHLHYEVLSNLDSINSCDDLHGAIHAFIRFAADPDLSTTQYIIIPVLVVVDVLSMAIFRTMLAQTATRRT